MRRQAEVEAAEAAVCRSAVVEAAVATEPPLDRLPAEATHVGKVVFPVVAIPVGRVVLPVVTSMTRVVLPVVTSMTRVVPVVTSMTRVDLVTSAEVATTSDRGPTMPSAASAANRGAMEPRLGAGALRREPAGAARSLHLEGFGTKGR